MRYVLMFVFPFILVSQINGIKNVGKYKIDEKPTTRIDDHMQGIWKIAEDTDKHNYLIVEKQNDQSFCLTYMNKGGNNRGLEHGLAFISDIDGTKFINFPNWDWDHHGWIYFKINKIEGPNSWDITGCIVMDTNLYKMNSSAEIRDYLKKNLNNPDIYGRELHLRKKFEFNSNHF